MRYKEINLNELSGNRTSSDENARVQLYMNDTFEEINKKRLFPWIIICPGGGYEMTSEREAEPVALRFLAHGFNAAVLRYSCKTRKFPVQLCEISALIGFLRKNAVEYNVQPDAVAVCGFSAGGHLAACSATLWHLAEIQNKIGLTGEDIRPNAAILAYPVISTDRMVHEGSFANLLGENTNEDIKLLVSLEKQVTEKTSPCFLWHTADDTGVPAGNSLLFASALSEKAISFEMHIYPSGRHGLSLANITSAGTCELINPRCAVWFDNAVTWLHEQLGSKI